MIRYVDVRPGDSRAYRASVDLGGVSVVLRLRWLRQVRAWTMTVQTPGGDDLSPPSIVRAGGRVLIDTTADGAPPGVLRWEGRDPIERTDLGTRCLLVWEGP